MRGHDEMDEGETSFALRIVQRHMSRMAGVYRREADLQGRDSLRRVGTINSLAFTAARSMLRQASINIDELQYQPLDDDWGVRFACYALVTAGLRDGERMILAANHLGNAASYEAAWWLGLLTCGTDDARRALRALRILVQAVP